MQSHHLSPSFFSSPVSTQQLVPVEFSTEPSQPLLSHEISSSPLSSNPTILFSTAQETCNPDLTSIYPKTLLARNLSYCSTADYLWMLEEYNHPFDLVDGILVLQEMADLDHDRIADYLHYRLRSYSSNNNEIWCVHKESKIFISKTEKTTSQNSDSPTTEYDTTFRRADLAVGYKESCCEVHSQSSPMSRTIRFPEEQCAPFMAIEITSTRSTRNDDLTSKRHQYLSRGIEQYIIIDRDKDNRHNAEKHKPSIICYLASNQGSSSSSHQDSTKITRYQFKDDEKIDVTFLKHLHLSPNDILQCPSSDSWDAQQVRMQRNKMRAIEQERDQAAKERDQAAKERDQASKDRDKAAKDRDQATKDRDKATKDKDQAKQETAKAKRKRERERQIRKRREAQLKEAGYPVTDSGSSESSCTSPDAKKTK